MTNHPNRTNSERVTINNLNHEREHVTLPRPHWTGRRECDTGLTLEALYSGPRTGRRFARTYSIWQKRGWNATGVVGTTYQELDEQAYLRLCQIAGVDPAHIEPTTV